MANTLHDNPPPVIVPKGTVLPPPRPGVRYVRVPMLGIVISDDNLRYRVGRRFYWPMIILALLVLPLLASEYLVIQHLSETDKKIAYNVVYITEAFISLAFLVEFMVKVTIAEDRIEYIRRNWLDIIIILLPFLRALRVVRAGTTMARTTRAFRLRGVGMKAARYVFTIVIGLEATDRLLQRVGIKRRKGRRKPERMTRHQLMDEVTRLRKVADGWHDWYTDRVEFEKDHGPTPLGPSLPIRDVEDIEVDEETGELKIEEGADVLVMDGDEPAMGVGGDAAVR
jgi:hypothetical protein